MFADRDRARRVRADAAGGLPRLRAGQLHLRRRARRLGLDHLQRWQWDLNWANPEVFCEFADIILCLANLGVEVLRLDAIAFLWKRMGTNCQNQPEVHAITQALRAVARIAAPAVLFKAEAIVGPRDLAHYLGAGKHAGKVSDLAYQNCLMVQIWSMLAASDARLSAPPCSGSRPAADHAPGSPTCAATTTSAGRSTTTTPRAVGLTGYDHRRFLADFYAGEFPGSSARGLVFQENLATGDRRISGTAASLAGLEASGTRTRRGDRPDPPRARDRRRLGRRAGALDGRRARPAQRPGLGREPGHEDDNRWVHRPRMDWTRAAARHDLHTVAGPGVRRLVHLARVRAWLPHCTRRPSHRLRTRRRRARRVAPSPRSAPSSASTTLPQPAPFELHRLQDAGLTVPYDALGGHPLAIGTPGHAVAPAVRRVVGGGRALRDPPRPRWGQLT